MKRSVKNPKKENFTIDFFNKFFTKIFWRIWSYNASMVFMVDSNVLVFYYTYNFYILFNSNDNNNVMFKNR